MKDLKKIQAEINKSIREYARVHSMTFVEAAKVAQIEINGKTIVPIEPEEWIEDVIPMYTNELNSYLH